ncbi:MAG: S-methyl-5-thioribose-1-phosphate isomerase [Actinobacteria bacterium HGW-Actinobacteria-9]|nr:MAG: S-methyl-5-thioribose-1-phosphate isomerase [Actinobacteria bacterium HGW-Actinobacteria-9]
MAVNDIPRTIWWEEDSVRLIDQSRLPLVGDLLACNTHEGVCIAVKTMAVRGAPALGVAAALAVAAWARNESEGLEGADEFFAGLEQVVETVKNARPTAVNLQWGAERMLKLARDNADLPLGDLRELLVAEAISMVEQDEVRNRALGAHGAELLGMDSRILTHCNAGSLATAYFGTALGVIFTAHEQGKISHVWVDETRPVMQGARLTSWELMTAGVPCTLITDNMAAWVMNLLDEDDKRLVDAVIVGADRIAANGDTANKIGTYGLAVLAHEHGIPFYVAAPTSTVDLTIEGGSKIPIEQRDAEEVTGVAWSAVFESPDAPATRALDALTEEGPYAFDLRRGHQLSLARKGGAYQFDGWARIAPVGVPVFNPSFDVTPARYITAIITENGVARPDYEESLAALCEGSGALHEVAGE